VSAEDYPPQVDLGLFTGITVFSENSGLGNALNPANVPGTGPLVGVRAGALLLQRRVGIEAEVRDTFTTVGDAGSGQVLGVRGQGLFYFANEGKVRPFALIGGGYEFLKTDRKSCGDTKPPPAGCVYVASPDDDWAFYLGGGARVPLSHRIALRGDARWLIGAQRPKDAQGKQAPSNIDNFEVTVGAVFALGGPAADEDKDGVPDDKDRCPLVAEDRDNFQDSDGCPDLDNDGDGIEDARDVCDNQAEDVDQFEDSDGCPDPDNDKDGVLDAQDRCKNEPEDKDGVDDADGCPDLDDDGDGLANDKDKCPKQKEDFDKFEDNDGCPEADNDQDGFLDAADKCPDKAEVKNGLEDTDGCPDTLPENVIKLFNGPIEGLDWKGASLVKGSEAVLEPLLELMLEHDDLRIELAIAPEADSDAARKLTDQRLAKLRGWLVESGIPAERLVSRVAAPAPPAPLPKPVKGVSRPVVTLQLLAK